MNKKEIIDEIKWRIKDCKEKMDDALNAKTHYEREKERLSVEVNAVRARYTNDPTEKRKAEYNAVNNRLHGLGSDGGVDGDIDKAHEAAYHNLVAMDTLERLLNTILEDEKK